MTVPIALTIAGSDSSGGAGIQADLKTFAALGVYGASVITALTAQNTTGVAAIHDVPADFIAAQIDVVLADLDVGAVKIGMLGNAAAAGAVAAGLDRHRPRNVVLDPVMVASTGADLWRADAMDGLRSLMSRADVVTPNLFEAAALSTRRWRATKTRCGRRRKAARVRRRRGADQRRARRRADSVDLLVEADGCARFTAPRIATKNTHGTGCTLAAAVAAGLAKGLALNAAVREAKAYVSAAIAAADRVKIGAGNGPVHHFHKWW